MLLADYFLSFTPFRVWWPDLVLCDFSVASSLHTGSWLHIAGLCNSLHQFTSCKVSLLSVFSLKAGSAAL